VPGNYNLRIHHDDPLAQRKREWLVEHWGALTALAGRCRVTPQMVREVYWGRRKSARIQRALRREAIRP